MLIHTLDTILENQVIFLITITSEQDPKLERVDLQHIIHRFRSIVTDIIQLIEVILLQDIHAIILRYIQHITQKFIINIIILGKILIITMNIIQNIIIDITTKIF